MRISRPSNLNMIAASVTSTTAQTAVIGTGISILVIIAYGDLRTRRIPNVLAAIVAVLGTIRMMLAADPIAAAHTIEASFGVLAVGFFAFRRGIVGGGDAKLIAATALIVGWQELLSFLFVMSIYGGALAVTILARDKLQRYWRLSRRAELASTISGAGPATISMRSTVPYGVAIAAAAITTLLHGTRF